MIKESSPNKGIIATIGMLVMIATLIVAVSVISSDKAEAAPSNNGGGNNNNNTNGMLLTITPLRTQQTNRENRVRKRG